MKIDVQHAYDNVEYFRKRWATDKDSARKGAEFVSSAHDFAKTVLVSARKHGRIDASRFSHDFFASAFGKKALIVLGGSKNGNPVYDLPERMRAIEPGLVDVHAGDQREFVSNLMHVATLKRKHKQIAKLLSEFSESVRKKSITTDQEAEIVLAASTLLYTHTPDDADHELMRLIASREAGAFIRARMRDM